MSEQNQTKKTASWRKLLAKRWLYPVMYVTVAGLMLVMMWAYQSNMEQNVIRNETISKSDSSVNPKTTSPDSVMETAKVESMQWPFQEEDQIETVMPFYESGLPVATREKAMIEYEKTFTPHTGIDFSAKNKQSFPVYSALSGTVTRVEPHPLLGQVIEIAHENGLQTVYQSLDKVNVTVDQKVRQGELIGQAGRNEFEKDLGVHLHFEVRQQGKAVNPAGWIPQPN